MKAEPFLSSLRFQCPLPISAAGSVQLSRQNTMEETGKLVSSGQALEPNHSMLLNTTASPDGSQMNPTTSDLVEGSRSNFPISKSKKKKKNKGTAESSGETVNETSTQKKQRQAQETKDGFIRLMKDEDMNPVKTRPDDMSEEV